VPDCSGEKLISLELIISMKNSFNGNGKTGLFVAFLAEPNYSVTTLKRRIQIDWRINLLLLPGPDFTLT